MKGMENERQQLKNRMGVLHKNRFISFDLCLMMRKRTIKNEIYEEKQGGGGGKRQTGRDGEKRGGGGGRENNIEKKYKRKRRIKKKGPPCNSLLEELYQWACMSCVQKPFSFLIFSFHSNFWPIVYC